MQIVLCKIAQGVLRRDRRKYLLSLKRWRAANPNYAREYYRKRKAAAQKTKDGTGT